MFSRIQAALAVLVLSAVFLGCGGGSDKKSDPPPAPVPPTITLQPQAQVVWAPAQASFTVQAAGTAPLAYQWARNGGDIPGATQAAFTTGLTSVDDHGALFTVKVTNTAGTVTSAAAALSVNQLPFVMQQPDDIVTVEGQAASFTARGQGTPVLHYQWKRNGATIPGATSAVYTLPAVTRADNQALFSAVISNTLGAIETRQALLQVGAQTAPPVITLQPLGGKATIGQSVTLSVQAIGTAPLKYQWRKNTVAISGATQSTFTLTNIQAVDAGNYSVVVSNDAGTATSDDAVLTVEVTLPVISTQPVDTWAGTGQSATFTVTAAGSPPMLYQWQRDGANLNGATQASYTTPLTVLADNGARFKVRITNPAGTVTSNEVVLHVYEARTVVGTAGRFWEAAAGETYVPRNLQSASVEALQLDGTGVFNRYPGTGAADGTFRVPGVPPGPYLLLLGGEPGGTPKGLWMVLGDPDFRDAALGRPDRTLVTGDQTNLAVNVVGALRGLTQGLWLYLPNLGLMTTSTGPGPIYHLAWKGLPLTLAAKDTLWALSPQVATVPEGELTTLACATSQPAPDLRAVGETQVDATPVALGQPLTLTVAVNQTAYAAEFAQISPALDPVAGRGPLKVVYGAQPAGGALGPVEPWGPLFTLVRTATADLAATPFAYADPYPVDWQRALQVRQEFSFDLAVPGGYTLRVADALQDLWPAALLPATPLAPRVHPVINPKIAGVSLFTPPASVGTGPVLSWQVQAPDAPSYHRITVFQVIPAENRLEEKVQYVTTVPSQKISAGIMEPGKYYVIRIQNVWGGSHDPAAPFLPSWPLSTAPVYSGILTP